MKKIRHFFGMITAMIMAWTLTLSAAAESFTITISNAQKNETYRVYRVLDVSVNADRTSYSYTIPGEWEAFFADDGAGYPFVTISDGYVSKKADADMEAFGKAAAAYAKTHSCTEAASAIIPEQDGPQTFTFSSPGYFLITSTNGTLSMTATTPEVTSSVIVEKNKDAQMKMEIQENSNLFWDNSNDQQIGNSVRIRNTITAEKGAVNDVLHCDLSEGFTFTGLSSVKAGSVELTENTDYRLVTEGLMDSCDFHVVFTESFLNSLTERTEIVVEYEPVLNTSAVYYPSSNICRTKLTYGAAGETEWYQTDTYTYMFDLIKLEAGTMEQLNGAQFEMYRTQTGNDRIALVKVENGVYRIATPQEKAQPGFVSAIIEAGKARIMGFDGKFTCFVEEIQAPDGFNRLSTRQVVDFIDKNILTNMEEGESWSEINGGIAVINRKGAILPATGGEGTFMFYLFGGALFVIGGILMIRKSSTVE